MPLGSLGFCQTDILNAEQRLRKFQADYCSIVLNRPKPCGLPPYIQPPKNAVRWQPVGDLAIPAVPAGADQLVFSERIPLGYDGILIAITNVWNGTGFVEASGDITWRIKQDRRWIPYYDSITTTRGTLSVPFDIVGQGIPLLSGQLLQYFVNFSAGSAAHLNAGGKTICALSGYIWPRETLVQ